MPNPKNKIEISVVVPAFNRPSTLRKTIEALVQQNTQRNWEVVVVDDGSSESLEQVRSEFFDRCNLVWFRCPENGGPAKARNKGIELASGEIILFTDADCRPLPNWIEALSASFDDPLISGAKGVYRTEQSDLWAKLAQIEFEERYALLAEHEDIDFVDTYSGGFRRADLETIGGFDTTFPKADNEDVDLSFRIKALGGKFAFVPDAIVYHQHREGWWNYAKLKFGRGFWRMKVYQRHPGKVGNDTYTPWTLKTQLALVGLLPLFLLGRRFRYLWALMWGVTCVPLIRHACQREPKTIPFVPLLALTRGLSLIAGITAGLIAGLEKDR